MHILYSIKFRMIYLNRPQQVQYCNAKPVQACVTAQLCNSWYTARPALLSWGLSFRTHMKFAAWLLFLQQVQRLFSQEVAACHLATVKTGSHRGGVCFLWSGSLPTSWCTWKRWWTRNQGDFLSVFELQLKIQHQNLGQSSQLFNTHDMHL